MKTESKLKSNTNPYIYNLCTGLLNNFEIVNYGKRVKGGVFDIVFRYFSKSDIIYLNWVEHSSFVKAIFLMLFFPYAKLNNKKIIWTHHNVYPHAGNRWFDPIILKYIIKYCDYIVVHTRESYSILNRSLDDPKIICFFHPFEFDKIRNPILSPTEKKYDVLIWGRVRKSKGFIEFLDFLKESGKLDLYKIKVIGKFENDEHYKETMTNYPGKYLSIENRFTTDAELDQLHKESKFIYFPYTGKSVLNSAALVKSLPKGTSIIGPNAGAFKELGERNLIKTYSSFEEVLGYLDDENTIKYPFDEIKEFCEAHTFTKFSAYMSEKLS